MKSISSFLTTLLITSVGTVAALDFSKFLNFSSSSYYALVEREGRRLKGTKAPKVIKATKALKATKSPKITSSAKSTKSTKAPKPEAALPKSVKSAKATKAPKTGNNQG